jgi:hypothetical protein
MADNQVNAPAILTDKKALLGWKTNHDLHVLLIMKRHGLSKGQAMVQAYHEGAEGLQKRLA